MKCTICGKATTGTFTKCYTCNQLAKNDPEISNTYPDTQTKAVTAPPNVQPKHIVKLQGKEFITHAGLLECAHAAGLTSITTEIVERTPEQCIMKATVMMGTKVFSAYGDADIKNVNSMIKLHMIRMAETRAVNRALRFATNIGMTSSDELGGKVPTIDEV